MNNEYIFFFVGGTCGSFVKTIFAQYLYKLNKSFKMPTLTVNMLTGNCHGTQTVIKHYHYIEQLDLTKKIVVIDFDENDVPSIIEMAFHKVVKHQISTDPEFLDNTWGLGSYRDNHKMLKQQFLNNPRYLIFEDWKAQINSINSVLTIKFKDIMFGDLNLIIANFFKVSPLQEVDEFIKIYRQTNQQYLTSDYKEANYPFTVEKLT